MKTYKVVEGKRKNTQSMFSSICEGCLFTYYDDYEGINMCIEPDELSCKSNIWVLEVLDDPNVPEVNER